MSAPSRILLVEDDPDFNTMLQDVLAVRGYDVEAYCDPLEAVKALEQGSWRLIITDSKMPGMTGESFARKCREVQKSAVLLVISGFLTEAEMEKFKEAGADKVLLKPLDLSEFISLVSVSLEN